MSRGRWITSRLALSAWLLLAVQVNPDPWAGRGFAQESKREKVLFAARPHDEEEESREGYRIFLMNADGSQQKALTKFKAFEVDPVWSPDGKRLAFVGVDPKSESASIYVMNADGSGRKQLTEQGANTWAAAPNWSPDGKRLVFHVQESEAKEREARHGRLFVMDADGQNRKRLGDGSGVLPAWSPDGKKVLYTVKEFEAKNYGINVMGADGTNAKVLLKGNAWMGVWSPDGKRIACVGRVEKNNAVIVMNADVSNPQPVSKGPGGFTTAVQWSADGKRLYFNVFQVFNGPFALFVMEANGANLKRLTDEKTDAVLWGTESLPE